MLPQFNFILRTNLIIVISATLVNCGGGGDSLPAKDTSPPKVVSTKPGSEAEGVRPGTEITVTFNKQISGVRKTNIDIYPVESGVVKKNLPVDFQLFLSSQSFAIEPITGALSPAKIYEVTITEVKDSANNQMVEPCSWRFATEGAISIKTGKSGVCGASTKIDPIPIIANEVIVDTDDVGTKSVGKWSRATDTPQTYGSNEAYAVVNSEVKSFRFTPKLSQASSYEVFVWTTCKNQRLTNVKHIIQHANGITTLEIDQNCRAGNAGIWFSLGTYSFNAGSLGYLEITNAGIVLPPSTSTTYISADAARFVRVGK